METDCNRAVAVFREGEDGHLLWRFLFIFKEANPAWFKEANPTWPYTSGKAAHVDLVACATSPDWSKLKRKSADAALSYIQNCRHHFVNTLGLLREGAWLLWNGRVAWRQLEEFTPVVSDEGKIEGGGGIEVLWCTGDVRVADTVHPFLAWNQLTMSNPAREELGKIIRGRQ